MNADAILSQALDWFATRDEKLGNPEWVKAAGRYFSESDKEEDPSKVYDVSISVHLPQIIACDDFFAFENLLRDAALQELVPQEVSWMAAAHEKERFKLHDHGLATVDPESNNVTFRVTIVEEPKKPDDKDDS